MDFLLHRDRFFCMFQSPNVCRIQQPRGSVHLRLIPVHHNLQFRIEAVAFPGPFPLLPGERNSISSRFFSTPINPAVSPDSSRATIRCSTPLNAWGTYVLILFTSSSERKRWVSRTEASQTFKSSARICGSRS